MRKFSDSHPSISSSKFPIEFQILSGYVCCIIRDSSLDVAILIAFIDDYHGMVRDIVDQLKSEFY